MHLARELARFCLAGTLVGILSQTILSQTPAAAAGRIYTVAGLPPASGSLPLGGGFGGDGGLATEAELDPGGIATEASGALLIVDTPNLRVRRVSRSGTITTVAGGGAGDPSAPNQRATGARFRFPVAVLALPAAGFLVADADAHRILRVNGAGVISVFAGSGTPAFAGDGGPAVSAQLRFPSGLARTRDGAILVADTGNQRIRRIEPNGSIHTIAGTGAFSYGGDGGPASAAAFRAPTGVAVDRHGRILVADSENDRIRRIDANGIIRTVAGSGHRGLRGDGGPAIFARFYEPLRAVARHRQIIVTDAGNNRIRKVGRRGKITNLAGRGPAGDFGGDGGPSTRAHLRTPNDAVVDPLGGVLIADYDNNVVRFIASPHTRRLAFAAPRSRVASSRCRTLRLSYVATRSGQLRVTVRHGTVRRRILVAAQKGKHHFHAGRFSPGDYHVRMVLRSRDSQTASHNGTLVVRRKRATRHACSG
jgi:NHL repeat-containing protein